MHSPLIFWELCVSCVRISPLHPYIYCAFQPVHFESISRWVAISWSGKFAESYALSRLRMHMLALFSCGILKGSLPVFSWVCYTHAVSYFTFYSWVDYVKKKLMFFYVRKRNWCSSMNTRAIFSLVFHTEYCAGNTCAVFFCIYEHTRRIKCRVRYALRVLFFWAFWYTTFAWHLGMNLIKNEK